MRIVIDLQACQSDSRFRGIGRYSSALTKAIARQAGSHEIWIALNDQVPNSIPGIRADFNGLVPKERIVTFSIPSLVSEDNPQNMWRTRAAELLREYFLTGLNADIVHVSSLFEGWYQDVAASIGVYKQNAAVSATLYDLIPLVLADKYLPSSNLKNYYFRKLESLKRAECLLAISEYTRQDAIKLLGLSPDSIINISSAVDETFKPRKITLEENSIIQERYHFNKAFILYSPGGFDERKNINNLITAYSHLPSDLRATHQLVITSKITDGDVENILLHARKQGLGAEELILPGYVPNEDLITLYNLCKLFIFPSLYEGFGLPALEAMACGAAVIGSNTSSIPEVIGWPEAMFDPIDPAAITEKMHQALTDEGFRKSLQESGRVQTRKFSWDNSAGKALAAFRSMHEKKIDTTRKLISIPKVKPRLAYFSPLPPEKSGISSYSAELISELARFYDITLINDHINNQEFLNADNIPIRDIAWFEAHADRFERILYQFGNSPFHKHMFEMLRRHPGTVVLHDFYLSSVIQWMEVTSYLPEVYKRSLFYSHGYPALSLLVHQGPESANFIYPCNRTQIDRADGIIVHSQFSINQCEKWYGAETANRFWYIPQLRSLPPKKDREQTRTELGLKADDFLVCSFGIVDQTKLNHRLLDAWLESSLMQDRHCHLVFVGENHGGEYGRALFEKISRNKIRDNIRMTGFASPNLYNKYLEAADVAVQLRSFSRGETSRSALDALAHGLPLIINAHGTMAEYPDDILIMLPDNFTNEELINSLENLYKNPDIRKQIGTAGHGYVEEFHNPEHASRAYYQAIEHFTVRSQYACYKDLIRSVADLTLAVEPDKTDLLTLAEAVAINTPEVRQKQLFLDISVLVNQDLKTGIERVTRSILLELLGASPAGYRVEPIYFDGDRYRYARNFTTEMLGIGSTGFQDDKIDVRRKDIILGLEWNPYVISSNRNLYKYLSALGVEIYFVIYDLLPLLHPKFFPPEIKVIEKQWVETICEVADGLICISRSVAVEVEEWLNSNPPNRMEPLPIGYFHLGADIENSAPTKGVPEEASNVLKVLESAPSFLMVGTVEPRKGHAQALSAFELLWDEGLVVNLVIVGKQGWLNEKQVERLRNHPMLGKRLFWLEGISDEYLEKIYQHSNAVIMASEGEGFGLPIIEAARNGISLILRDLPVFREVAGEHAAYFTGLEPSALSAVIVDWLEQDRQGKTPSSREIRFLTWNESARSLIHLLQDPSDPKWVNTWRSQL